jgi:peptidoglycan hydrolase-like protein with peptidoglycan-binding domain
MSNNKSKNKKNSTLKKVAVVGGVVGVGVMLAGYALEKDPFYIVKMITGNWKSDKTPFVNQAQVNVENTVSNAGFPVQKGSKGANVKLLQQALISKYGSILPAFGADGDFGSETETALKSKSHPTVFTSQAELNSFIKSLGNSTTLPATPTTNARDGLPFTANSNVFNPRVKELQIELNKRNFTDTDGKKLVEDGKLGNKTRQAMAKAGFPSSLIIGQGSLAILPVDEVMFDAFINRLYPFKGLGNLQKNDVIVVGQRIPIYDEYRNLVGLADSGTVLGQLYGRDELMYHFVTRQGNLRKVRIKETKIAN